MFRIVKIQSAYPSIQIGNKKDCMVNDVFSSGSIIVWHDDVAEEEIYAKSTSSHKPYIFSKTAFEKKKVPTPRDFLRHTQGSSRGRFDIWPGVDDKEHFPMKRLALVVGNTHYEWEANLTNAYRDAKDVSNKLHSLGFDVITLYDASSSDMEDAVEYFYKQADKYQVSLLYYAGHGLQNDGSTYLVPCDVDTQPAKSKKQLTNVIDILDRSTYSKCRNNFVVLDACRDIKTSWTRSTNVATNQIEPPTGVCLMYSTSSGYTASDGEFENSPFATAFLKEIGTPDVSYIQTLDRVRLDVIRQTNGKQVPLFIAKLLESFVFQCGEIIISPIVEKYIVEEVEPVIEVPDEPDELNKPAKPQKEKTHQTIKIPELSVNFAAVNAAYSDNSSMLLGATFGSVGGWGWYVKVLSTLSLPKGTAFSANNKGYVSDTFPAYTGLSNTFKAESVAGISFCADDSYGVGLGIGYGYRQFAWQTVDGQWISIDDGFGGGTAFSLDGYYVLNRIVLNAGVLLINGSVDIIVGVGVKF